MKPPQAWEKPFPLQGPVPGMHVMDGTEEPEETVVTILRRYEGKGFTGQFSVRAAGDIQCLSCRVLSRPNQVALLALHRVEGSSDPGEMAAVVALECPKCQQKGTLVLAFGSGASSEEALALAAFSDQRGGVGLRSGI